MKFRKTYGYYYISSTNKNNEYEYVDWLVFYWGWNFDISFELCGYFDNRPRINLDLIFFSLSFILPFRNSWTDECDPPKWGVAYHNQTLWIYRGGKGNMKGGNKWWTFYSPFSLQWYRTSMLRNDGTWEHEFKSEKLGYRNKQFWDKEKWKDVFFEETHPYFYVLNNGSVQRRMATIQVTEREWRPHWFKWLPLTKKVRKSIDIEFNEEVGERTDTWKGGTLGCSYEMLPNETPRQTLRRMEINREFI